MYCDGQERGCLGLGMGSYDVLVAESIEKADGFILAYSMLDFDSFIEAQRLYCRITRRRESLGSLPNAITIVATKSDKRYERKVTVSSGHSFAADKGCDYFECSAETGESVNAAFSALVKALRAGRGKGKSKEQTL